MKKCLLVLVLIAFAGPSYAQDTQRDPDLEKKYATEFQLKVTQETAKAKDSLDTLFYGMAAVAAGVTLLGVLALVGTRKQERELELIKAKMQAASA